MEEVTKALSDLANAVNNGFKVTNDNLNKLDQTVKEEGSKTRNRVGFNTFLTFVVIALIAFCCFFKSGCNTVGKETIKEAPCKLNTEMWVTGTGEITDPEAIAAFKGTETIYLSFSTLDGERFKKVNILATAQEAGKKIEYLIDFQKGDSVNNFCTFLIQEYKISDELVSTTSEVSNPAQTEAPKPRTLKPRGGSDSEIKVEDENVFTEKQKAFLNLDLTPVADAKKQLADTGNYKTNVTFGNTGDVLNVIYTNEVITDIPTGTFVPKLHLTRADSIAKGLY